MPEPLLIREVRICPLAIPMRLRFEHAAASREVADPVLVRVTAAAPYADLVGWGETLARPYVTGETATSVVSDLVEQLTPRLGDFRPRSFPEALEFLEALPSALEGRVIQAARAALELALLDLAGQAFRRRASDAAGWLGLPGFGAPGCLARTRFSGMVIGRSRRKLSWLLRAQRFWGLRDFKLKVAVPGWEDRLRWTWAVLRGPLERGQATLRVDANAGWTLDEAQDAVELLEHHGVTAIEQPLPDADDGDLPALAEQTGCDLIADESLLDLDDAQRLLAGGVRVLNIRIAKNGGLLPALRLARAALATGADVQLGCLVGETSILSAAGVAFLEACPSVRFAEGAFGRWLLRADVARRPVQFGRGGRIAARPGFGLGLTVDEAAVERLAAGPATVLRG